MLLDYGRRTVVRIDRITVNPGRCRRQGVHSQSALSGSACWDSWRRRVGESILRNYPYLEAADIDAALLYAVYLAEDETVELNQ